MRGRRLLGIFKTPERLNNIDTANDENLSLNTEIAYAAWGGLKISSISLVITSFALLVAFISYSSAVSTHARSASLQIIERGLDDHLLESGLRIAKAARDHSLQKSLKNDSATFIKHLRYRQTMTEKDVLRERAFEVVARERGTGFRASTPYPEAFEDLNIVLGYLETAAVCAVKGPCDRQMIKDHFAIQGNIISLSCYYIEEQREVFNTNKYIFYASLFFRSPCGPKQHR